MPSAPARIRILCVEDNPGETGLLGKTLARVDPDREYLLRRVDEPVAFIEALRQPLDVVVCDYNLRRFSPFAALQLLKGCGSDVPLVVLTQAIGEEAAVHVLRCGARDYLAKDKLGTLPQIIDRVMAERAGRLEQERLTRELATAYARLRQLSARLVLAQERERSLVSRELHDVLGQTLTGMMIHLHAASRAKTSRETRQFTDTAMKLAHEAVAQVRTLSFSLRPAQLDLLGLVSAVRSAAQRIAEPAGLGLQVSVRGAEPAQLHETASVFVRLVQESLTNVARHASATLVRVRLRFLPLGRIGLLVIDNGKGFDKHAVLDGQPSERNVGLYGMIERTELAGGRICIRTRPGDGVAIRAVL